MNTAQRLTWVNSFVNQKNRGTWKNPATEICHETEGFLIKQKGKKPPSKECHVSTVGANNVSDHRAKRLICYLGKHQINSPKSRCRTVEWERLRYINTGKRFRTSINDQANRLDNRTEACMEAWVMICGQRARKNLKPWMNTKIEEIENFKKQITQMTRNMNEGVTNAREERITRRNQNIEAKKRW